MDANKDGKVDYNEFISASSNRCKMLSEKNLTNAFNTFDANGDGFITKDEMMDIFARGSNFRHDFEVLWAQMLIDADKDKDGKLHYDEFKEAMMKVIEHRASFVR